MRGLVTQTLAIPSNGITLHAEVAGPEDGPMIVLLHGFPEYWGAWAKHMGPLARSGFRVVAPDQRGYNLSDRPADVSAYEIDELAKDVLGILNYFGREKAVILGHDWGAAVAWYLGMHYPARVERLVIINVPHQAAMNRALRKPLPRQLGKSSYVFYFQTPRVPEFGLSAFNYAPLRQSMIRTSRPGTFSKEDLRRYTEAWSRKASGPGQTDALTGGLNWYRAMGRLGMRLGEKAFNEKFAVRVTVPTLVLWGDRDAFVEPELADWSMEWVDDGRLIRFPEATHWIHHEEVERVSSRVLDFIEGLRQVRER